MPAQQRLRPGTLGLMGLMGVGFAMGVMAGQTLNACMERAKKPYTGYRADLGENARDAIVIKNRYGTPEIILIKKEDDSYVEFDELAKRQSVELERQKSELERQKSELEKKARELH